MNRIKDDLICEIIRVSQTNFLGRKRDQEGCGEDEQVVVDWIKKNAKDYRNSFKARLDLFSTRELGDILKNLTRSGKDLSQVLENSPWPSTETKPVQ